MASQSTLRLVLKLPPTTMLAWVVVLLCTLIAPLSPLQLELVVEIGHQHLGHRCEAC